MDLASYRDGWEARLREESARASLAREEARAALPSLVELLVQGFGADFVALIGSLAQDGAAFRPDSDLDLVARGLEGAALFKAGAALERLAGRDVDLIPLEDATPALLEELCARGEVLHGAL
jgi:predicted nucleotidyltransferase